MYRSTGKREHLTRVERAHERMANIVKDVLTLARQGRTVNETRPISGETVATNAWASVETGPATLDSSWNSIINADASRLQQLLENLFRNALDHGRPDVTIRVGELTGVVEDGGLRQKTATGDAAAGFFVEDDGPGIPQAARKTVFESGYSTAESGTGLGLTIVRQIAEAHGWEVSLVAADDGGARFEFAGVEPMNE
ncbi:sensor histidine kinase KdpD [Haladaptatus sp. R4]|uniref:sensor histidine kinase n=1 Tax=Haladaptatus sp. R4 TaxID=1679489 RepID=UPI000A774D3A|nr:HAMP domain-containing sensor histidine kinase [Haladaptatus sp. R4]